MKVEKKQEGATSVEKKAARKGIAGGARKVEKKQEGAKEIEKKTSKKGIAGGATKVQKNQEGAIESEKKATGKVIPASGSSSGGETVTILKSQELAECDKAEAGKEKGVQGKMPVSQRYIDMLLKEKATGTGAYKVSRSMEYVEKYKGPHDLRSLVARSDACMEKVRAEDAKILEQYELFGCAYTDARVDISVADEEKIRRYLPRWPLAA